MSPGFDFQRIAAAAALLFGTRLAHANFAPLARATATPSESLVGQSVVFSSASSIDPDDGPAALTFAWDFGDGTSSTAANPDHSYLAPGSYDVTLTVSDGLSLGIDTLTVYVLEQVTPGRPAQSSPLALSRDGHRLYVVNQDSNSLSIVDTTARSVEQELSVCEHPQSVALGADDGQIYVVCQTSNELWVFDTPTHQLVGQRALGHRPYGVVVGGDGRVFVSNEGSASITVLESGSWEPTASVQVANDPRALALSKDGTILYVTHFLTRGEAGRITLIDTASLSVIGEVPLAEDPAPDTTSSGAGFPNLLGALGVHPDGKQVWYGGLKSNTSRGVFNNGLPLVPTNRVRGLMGLLDGAGETIERRIDTNDADGVVAITFSPLGRYAYAAHPGIAAVSIYDLLIAAQHDASDGSTVPFASRIEVCAAPQGLSLAPDGKTLYVACLLERAVAFIDVQSATEPSIVTELPVTSEPLAAEVALGKKLFFSSRPPLHSSEGYIACASCHPDGGMDGRTWDFTDAGEGLRNTIDLRGKGGMDHGPVHWSANFDEIQDFENDIVHGFGGEGLAQDGDPPHPSLAAQKNAGRSAELDALAAYVSSLRTAPLSPEPADPEAIARGRRLFESSKLGCTTCHQKPRLTDSVLTDPEHFVLHDVGTLGPGSGQRLSAELLGLDTPSLIGVRYTAPYLHDGSAATLHEVLTTRNPSDRHGVTSHLGAGEIDDLVAFMLSLDRPLEDAPGDREASDPSCGCRSSRATTPGELVLALLALALLSRRKSCRRRNAP